MQNLGKFKVNASISPLSKGGLRRVFGLAITLLLLLAVACGAAATATPAPTATPTPPRVGVTPPPDTAALTPTAAPSATPTPTAAPALTRPKVERLRLALSPSGFDTNLTWGGGPPHLVDKRPVLEHLIGLDRSTGAWVPELATKWEMGPDAQSLTLELRKGIQFHDGWGEFTARDVVFSIWTITQAGSLAAAFDRWRPVVGSGPNVEDIAGAFEIVDDHKLVIRLKAPDSEIDFLIAANAELVIQSRARWDKEGVEGFKNKLVGTGPYKFKERALGQFVLLERVENHWRHTPEFKELQIISPPEDATRLATLLAGETHMAQLPQALQKEPLAKGMKRVSGRLPGVQFTWKFGGLYFATPDKLDAKAPFVDKRVREAMNRAVNRKELLQQIFDGRGEFLRVHGHHPSVPGWNPEWEKRFDELYGYDPARAKALLNEAGYPNGFRFKLYLAPLAGLAEAPQIGEALDLYFRAIGLQPQLVQTEPPKVVALARKKEMHGGMWAVATGAGRPQALLRNFNVSTGGIFFAYENSRIDAIYNELLATVDPGKRERLLREAGDIRFFDYQDIPLVWLSGELVINPKVVAEYVWSGNIAGLVSHLEYVKAAR